LSHKEEDNRNYEDKRATRCRGQGVPPPPPGEIVIEAKFVGHVLRCLAFSLSNVVRQTGR